MSNFEAQPSFLKTLSSKLVTGDEREGSGIRELLDPLFVLLGNQGSYKSQKACLRDVLSLLERHF